ncbi:MAG: hypothetical protein AAFX50_08515, partial [Acidobacteriota bacterium]
AEPAAWPLIAGGIALVLFGKRLYWFALAGLGAAVAVTAAAYLEMPTAEGRLVVAVIAAVAGALLAIFAQRLVVSALGFMSGAAVSAWATPLVWPDAGLWLLAIAFGGGLIGVLFSGRLFDGLLIVATSAAGAWLIAQAVPGAPLVPVAFTAFMVGLVAQSRTRRRRKRREED